jgi:predicted flavoprotein YhiN
MATGGMSFPSLGTDGHGLKLLQKMGHKLHSPYPALTPLKGTHVASSQLAGEQWGETYTPNTSTLPTI